MSTTEGKLSPAIVLSVARGFQLSKCLFLGVKFDLFNVLEKDGPLTGAQIQEKLKLDWRVLYDWLDLLALLGFLTRTGIKDLAIYANTPVSSAYLVSGKPGYLGAFLIIGNDRNYKFWGEGLDTALLTGKPQNLGQFKQIYSTPSSLAMFAQAMSSNVQPLASSFAQKFDLLPYKTLCDVGGCSGTLCTQVVLQYPHMRCINFDLPAMESLTIECLQKAGMSDKVSVVSGDFLKGDKFPKVDVIVMANVLHCFNVVDRKKLVRMAYEALPPDGVLVVLEALIDDERKNYVPLTKSITYFFEVDGENFSRLEFEEWSKEAGFVRSQLLQLVSDYQAIISFR